MAVPRCSEQRAHSSALAVQPGDVGWGGSGRGAPLQTRFGPRPARSFPSPMKRQHWGCAPGSGSTKHLEKLHPKHVNHEAFWLPLESCIWRVPVSQPRGLQGEFT